MLCWTGNRGERVRCSAYGINNNGRRGNGSGPGGGEVVREAMSISRRWFLQ